MLQQDLSLFGPINTSVTLTRTDLHAQRNSAGLCRVLLSSAVLCRLLLNLAVLCRVLLCFT